MTPLLECVHNVQNLFVDASTSMMEGFDGFDMKQNHGWSKYTCFECGLNDSLLYVSSLRGIQLSLSSCYNLSHTTILAYEIFY